jgi:hypothetical protein
LSIFDIVAVAHQTKFTEFHNQVNCLLRNYLARPMIVGKKMGAAPLSPVPAAERPFPKQGGVQCPS